MTEIRWPALPLDAWQDTYQTLHLWTQIVGKIRLTLSPKVNHWWHTTLYVNARGLTTSPIPYGNESFEIQFDFLDHRLDVLTSTGRRTSVLLKPMPVAEFYSRVMSALGSLGIQVAINTKPQELPNPIPFEQDFQHTSYDPEYAHRFWLTLVSAAEVLQEFRGRFIGKCSPVQFFWGSFDLACTRFSGRPAPPRKGVITAEAYSHECCSAGFWPGAGFGQAAFYSYTAPAPPGLSDEPGAAKFWNPQLSEFVLPYEEVRTASSPRMALLDFLEATYSAGATLGGWDRSTLERPAVTSA
jgi:Family of unknown function (DUF5996)